VRLYGRFEMAIKTTGRPAALAPLVFTAVREAAATAPVETIPLMQRVDESVSEPRRPSEPVPPPSTREQRSTVNAQIT